MSRRLLGPALAGLALAGAALGGGCAGHRPPAPPPPLRGVVSLDRLVRRHPGWPALARYDAALARLEAASRTARTARPDAQMASLPALPDAPPAEPAGDAGKDVAGEGTRLAGVQQALLSDLRDRRDLARTEQIGQGRDVWRREARTRFLPAVPGRGDSADLETQLLQANIAALTQTLNNWRQALPPKPGWEALQAKVAREQARYDALLVAQASRQEAARVARLAEGRRVHEARVAYVQAQADALDARLRADDARVISDQRARLDGQRAGLLRALAQPGNVSVPASGYAGAEVLPHGPGVAPPSVSAAGLTASEARLRAQRARWVRFLYDDTRAAALDAAARQRWEVTFGPGGAGGRDLTDAMASALASGVWRR